MPQGQISSSIKIGSLNFSGTTQRSGETELSSEYTLAAATAGALTVRTNDTSGDLTMESAGHGIVQTDRFDLYWVGGYAYACTAGVVSGTAIAFTTAAGTVLPAQATAILTGERTQAAMAFDGDNMTMIAAQASARAAITFEEADNTVSHAQELATGNEPWYWVDGQGVTLPITGVAVALVQMSSGTAVATNMKVGVILDTV